MAFTGKLGVDGLGQFGLGNALEDNPNDVYLVPAVITLTPPPIGEDVYLVPAVITLTPPPPMAAEVVLLVPAVITLTPPPPEVDLSQGNRRPFNAGGLGTQQNARPFNVFREAIDMTTRRPFNVTVGVSSSNSRPFNVTAALQSDNRRPFNVTRADPHPQVETGGTGGGGGGGGGAGGGGGGSGGGGSGGAVAGFLVFDKAGNPLGSIPSDHMSLADAPSRLISDSGSLKFYMPRKLNDGSVNPSFSMVADDNLLAVGWNVGLPLWAGTMTVQDHGDGRLQVDVPDVTALWGGSRHEMALAMADSTPATSVYLSAIALMNTQRGRDNEIEWATDVQGSAAFRGDLNEEGTVGDLLEAIAASSDTEYAWRAELASGGRLRLTVVVRDRIVGATGTDFSDGDGGNVVSQPRYSTDPSTLVNRIHLVGSPTNIQDLVPEWARWAVHEVQPEALATNLPGAHRRREIPSTHVSWTLSLAEQQRLAQLTVDTLRAMYYSFLRAFHDIEGRPYHEGWKYTGPPPLIEAGLHTGLGWRTHLIIAEWLGQPVSVVMLSVPQSLILTVGYDRITGVQTVRRSWFAEADGTLYALRMRVHGWTYRYRTDGGVITQRNVTPYDHSQALVEASPTTYMWPHEDGTVTYHDLRRVISLTEDGSVSEGQFFDATMPTGPTDTVIFTRPTIGDAPYKVFELVAVDEWVTLDGSFINKVYDFEEYRIRDWDPRRDGVGVLLNRRTVWRNQPSTHTRNHVVPWGTGADGVTSLINGMSPTDTVIQVESAFVLPVTFPYEAILGEDPGDEVVTVVSGLGSELTIVRGVDAIIHEPGEPFAVKDVTVWDGFVFPFSWPEGDAYAARLLERLHRRAERLAFSVNNEGGTWGTVDMGSIHQVDLNSIGPAGGIHMQVRVLGYAPDAHNGSMEVIVEPWP